MIPYVVEPLMVLKPSAHNGIFESLLAFALSEMFFRMQKF